VAGDISHLFPPTRQRIEALLRDPWCVRTRGGVYSASGCRSHALQAQLRWNYEHVPGSPLAAVPGTSPHEIGAKVPGYCVADDLGFRAGNPPGGNRAHYHGPRHPDWAELERVAARYGLARTVPSEEWHYQLAGSPPVLIPPAAPGPPDPWDHPSLPARYAVGTPLTLTIHKPTLRLGDQGPQVAELQALLRVKAHQEQVTVDGGFGIFTQSGLDNVQRFFGIFHTGGHSCGPKTWKLLLEL
jgi:hypothetical protein